MSRIPTRKSARQWLSYRRYRARLAWAVWRGWLDTVPVGFFDGPTPLSLEDVDELFEVIGDYDDLIGWLVGPHMVEYECLPRLRKLRTALADAMERYEGERDVSALPDWLPGYLAERDRERQQQRAEAFARFTPREQRLIREAAVMGFVRGSMYCASRHDEEPEIPRDVWIVEQVLAGCLSFDDIYPLIATGEMPVERYEGEGGRADR